MTSVRPKAVHPAGWPKPSGFSHGVAARGLFVAIAGQIGVGEGGDDDAGDGSDVDGSTESAPEEASAFARQFARALERVVAVVEAAGGRGEDVVSLTIYVTSLGAYRAARPSLASAWKRHFPSRDPAVALVEVKGLFDAGAVVEIAGQAIIPEDDGPG